MSSSTPPAAYTEEWLAGPASTSFYTRLYTPPAPARAALVFAHGFVEHVGRYAHVFPAWAAAGVAVLAFDQRGFGRTALDAQRSAGSSYGRTDNAAQRADLRWALDETRRRWPGVPLFLMGHSMGGGLVLSFCTLNQPTDLAGVIATSPLIAQTTPTPRLLLSAGRLLSKLLPNQTYPAAVDAAALSRDPSVCKAYTEDHLVVQSGTLKGINTMLEAGDILTTTGYKAWPKALPLLLIHGTDDKVCSVAGTQKFYDSIAADDKTLSLYEGGFHELQNEPDGMGARLVAECVAWAEAHIPAVAKL